MQPARLLGQRGVVCAFTGFGCVHPARPPVHPVRASGVSEGREGAVVPGARTLFHSSIASHVRAPSTGQAVLGSQGYKGEQRGDAPDPQGRRQP